MRVGTKSVLFGVHQFMIHPWFVAAAWIQLYGWPFDPRIWLAFFVHDLGYLGCPNMDGEEGEHHVALGARIMGWLFDKRTRATHRRYLWEYGEWYDFCLYHSRFYAKAAGRKPSRLCYADKLSIALTPWWIYIPLGLASGEIHEYLRRAGQGKYNGQAAENRTPRLWLAELQRFMRQWVAEHKED